jgi:hypothetical protein
MRSLSVENLVVEQRASTVVHDVEALVDSVLLLSLGWSKR